MGDSKIEWTEEMLEEFDRINWRISDLDQMERIRGRGELRRFQEEHGRDVCNAMFRHLTGKDPAA